MTSSGDWTAIFVSGFGVAFLHSSLPTHWLPFVAVSRMHKWSQRKTLLVTALASLGHTITTTTLGALIVLFGIHVHERAEEMYHFASGSILIAFGIYYFNRQRQVFLSEGHYHGTSCAHGLKHFSSKPIGQLSEKAAILYLILMLSGSPCEAFLPVYLSGVSFGWQGFLVLSLILITSTFLGMVAFTWAALHGWQKIGLSRFEKYENAVIACLLVGMGILTLLTRH